MNDITTATGKAPRLPPTAARIFRVAAGLSHWTAEERDWLRKNPGWLGYQDQLEATLEDVQREIVLNSGQPQPHCRQTASCVIGGYDI